MEESQTPSRTIDGLEENMPESARSAFEKVLPYVKPIGIGIAVALIIILVISVYRSYQQKQFVSANNEFGAIMAAATGQQRIEKLEGFLKESPAALKSAVLIQIAEGYMNEQQPEKALQYWDNLSKDYKDFHIVAELGAAKALLLSDKASEALSRLQAVAAKAPESYKLIFTRQIADAAAQAGDKELAIAKYKELLDAGTAQDKPLIEYNIRQLQK